MTMKKRNLFFFVLAGFVYCLCKFTRVVIVISTIEFERSRVPSPVVIYDTWVDRSATKYVSMCEARLRGDHRTGNHMFMLAAMIYIAKLTGRELVMPRTGWKLDEAFDLSAIKRMDNISKTICPCRTLPMKHHDFDVSFDDEKYVNSLIQSNDTLLVCGLSQTFRYTIGIEHILRDVLKFRPETVETAKKCFNPDSRDSKIGQFYNVGIHIRGGDFLHPSYKNYGLTVATESYYRNAVEHICRSHENVRLFVTSDNITNAKRYISKVNAPMSVYYSNNTLDVDLAMLSMSDAVIMSTGTFGWWAAWLANKTTIYYKNYPRIGSTFALKMNLPNYYCSNWMPMEWVIAEDTVYQLLVVIYNSADMIVL